MLSLDIIQFGGKTGHLEGQSVNCFGILGVNNLYGHKTLSVVSISSTFFALKQNTIGPVNELKGKKDAQMTHSNG